MTQSELKISCGEVLWEISSHLEQDVPKGLRARLEAHFRKCSRCRAVADEKGNLLRLVGDGRSFALPPGFSGWLQRIAAAFRKH